MSAAVMAAWSMLALALLPLALAAMNLALLRPPPRVSATRRAVSVLIPARDEERNIAAAVESVLANRDGLLELIVLDDDSSDATADIVAAYARRDERVRLLTGRRFDPALWGKPQACAALAAEARGDVLLFMDADVTLAGDAVGRIAAALETSEAGMLSGVPAQITRSPAEKLIVPLIHFVLLGFLPLAGMRLSRWRAFGVGCGQLAAVDRRAYERAGGHLAVADRIHDGMALARSLRAHGVTTDLADFGPLASCRMYRSTSEVVAGFAKNAHEGLGSPAGIVPWSVLLLGGQSAWLVLLPVFAAAAHPAALPTALAALAAIGTRLMLTIRFRQSWLGALLHPVGIAWLVAIQWYALVRRLIGRPVAWKARSCFHTRSFPRRAAKTPRTL